MAIRLSPKETQEAQVWLASLFAQSNIVGSKVRQLRGNYFFQSDCNKICNEIINRQFTFVKDKLDSCLTNLANAKFKGPGYGWLYRSPAILAKYIAWFCLENDIIWDDTNVTTNEMDAYKQTILGGILIAAGCFASTQAAAQTANTTTSKAPSARQPGQPPVNSYKSSGAHSQDIPNLVGQANQKANFNQPLFCVEADKVGKNTPCAFITPIKTSQSGVVKVSKTAAETINFGSGNGYTDCCLWFILQTDAQKLVTFCQNSPKFNKKYTNFHIAKGLDNNGYFMVTTEAGPAYIQAKKLNEALEKCHESCSSESEEIYENASKNFKITDIDLYDEWMHKSIS